MRDFFSPRELKAKSGKSQGPCYASRLGQLNQALRQSGIPLSVGRAIAYELAFGRNSGAFEDGILPVQLTISVCRLRFWFSSWANRSLPPTTGNTRVCHSWPTFTFRLTSSSSRNPSVCAHGYAPFMRCISISP